MKKIILVLCLYTISIEIFAVELGHIDSDYYKHVIGGMPQGAGYPVMEEALEQTTFANYLQAIDQAFQAYDQVMNTITQIENQYEQIQQAIEAAKSIDWDEFGNFEGGFDIRKDIKNTGRRVNNVLNKARNIENLATQPSISIGGEQYSIADLCGVGGVGQPGSEDDPAGMKNFFGKKNLWTAMKDEANYMGEQGKKIGKSLTEGLTEEEAKAIYMKYGISASNYAYVQQSKNKLKNEVKKAMIRCNEEARRMAIEGTEAEKSAIYNAVYGTKDRDGNPTDKGLHEGIFMMCQHLADCMNNMQEAIEDQANQSGSLVLYQLRQEETSIKAAQDAQETEKLQKNIDKQTRNAKDTRFYKK